MRAIAALVCVICLTSSTSLRAHFEPGQMRFGFGLGLRSTDAGSDFIIGGSFGVFVLKGLDVSFSPTYQTGSAGPTLLMLTGDVRFIPLSDLTISPYVKAGGGHLFVEGDNAWIASAGGGLIYMAGPWYAIDMGLIYRWFFFPDGQRDETYGFQGGVIFFF